MKVPIERANSRRKFLRLLATTPALPFLRLSPIIAQAVADDRTAAARGVTTTHDEDPDGLPDSVIKSIQRYDDRISSAKDAVNVFDLETVARKKLNVGHLADLTAVEDQAILRANREGFKRFELRARRLAGVDKVDMSVTLFGRKWPTPIILCPCGAQRAFNSEGEVAVARAARAKNHLQTLSTDASRSIEDVTAARGEPVWFQLYRDLDWNKTRAMIKRAEATGSPVIVFTADIAGHKREILEKVRRQNAELCQTCHKSEGPPSTPPMVSTPPLGLPMMEKGPTTWDYVKRLKDSTSMKLIVKSIVTAEDAELAMRYGADGIWISNHGGERENSGRSTIECVREVVTAVARRGPVIVDSGFRRGTDIFKALALGATAIGVGRP
jgi:4-hydroxymandelate oxidase